MVGFGSTTNISVYSVAFCKLHRCRSPYYLNKFPDLVDCWRSGVWLQFKSDSIPDSSLQICMHWNTWYQLLISLSSNSSLCRWDSVVCELPASRSAGCGFEHQPGETKGMFIKLESTTSSLGAWHSGMARRGTMEVLTRWSCESFASPSSEYLCGADENKNSLSS